MDSNFEDRFYITNANDLDLEDCIKIIIEVSDGLLDGLFNKISIDKALLLVSQNDNDIFKSDNMYLVKDKESNAIVAMLFAYKIQEDSLPLILRTLLNKDKFETLKEVMLSGGKDSFYINTLYVNENYRGYGFASLLLDLAKELAQSSDCNKTFLHCFSDNEKALSLYKSYNFNIVKNIEYKGLLNFKHPFGYILCQTHS